MLAGGQSLVPLLKLRFASPELLVDINNLPGPRLPPRRPRRHHPHRRAVPARHLERSSILSGQQPTMAAAAPLIADPIVRNRGTLVGSLCHADPQGDWASVVTALGGYVVAQGLVRPAQHPGRRLRHRPVPERPRLRRDRGRGGDPGAQGDGRRRLPQAGAPGRRLRHRRHGGRARAVRRRGHPGRDRADRRRRLHHRRHRRGAGAGRRPAHRREHRPGGRTGRAGRPAPDRPPRQRRATSGTSCARSSSAS